MLSTPKNRNRKLITAATGAAAFAALSLALSGCSITANPTVAAADVATLAATALSEQWGTAAEVDCGEDSVASVEGTVVDCTAFNPKSGLSYPAAVTLTKIEGTSYTVSVEVGAAIVEEDESVDSGAPADAPTVTPESLADIAATALEEQLGARPEINCGTERIAIYLDAEIECVAVLADGISYPANIVVTEVTATDYKINVEVGATPIS